MPRSATNAGRTWGFSTAGRVFFGPGSLAELRLAPAEFGSRAFVCTDRNMIACGISAAVEARLKEGGAEVCLFPDGRPEMDVATILEATAEARRFRPDMIVGVGGGSNLDLSKAVSILLRHPEPLSTYYGESNVPGPVVPIIAIPTTAGTGSEVSPVSVVSDPSRAMKVGIASRRIIPSWAIVDPSLTLSCPPHVTAHSGMDALTHAIEAFCATIPDERSPQAVFVGKNAVSDSFARRAIQLITRALERTVKDPGNETAREHMALGSLLAGMAFSCAGTAAVHALQYPVGEATHTPHGLGNAVLLPTVMKAISGARIPEMAFIARCFDSALRGETDETAARYAPALVKKLGQAVQIPDGLQALGLERARLPEMAQLASTVKRLVDNSPVLFDQTSLLGILEEAY